MDLLLLGELRLAPAVVQIHHGQRLDEEGRAAAGLVVDQAGDAALELGPQWDDITSLALCDDRLLQELRVGRGRDDALEPFHQPGVRLAHLAADAHQRIAGRVHDLPAVVDAAHDLVDQVAGRRDARGDVGDLRELLVEPRQEPLDRPRARQRAADVQQIRRQQRAAAHGLLRQRPQVVDAAQMQVALLVQQAARLARLGLPGQRLAEVVGRLQGERALAAERKRGLIGQPIPNLVELEYA
ncbi:MAG: hypothetical protein BWY52_03377 [Chloroflexi bacterium ADurb.Bin325]|nr:MAG: hypothetical protein BWY52_03377 [Chloroflexi bacterium ADurb.Bin325]